MNKELPVPDSHFLTDFLFFIQCKQIRNLASIKQVIDVLQEWLFFNLTVRKQEDTVDFSLGSLS